jgi:hypothetical protein
MHEYASYQHLPSEAPSAATPTSTPTPSARDTKLAEMWAPVQKADTSHLIGMRTEENDVGFVSSRDYVDPAAATRGPAPAVDLSTARTSSGIKISDPAALTLDSIIAFDGMETTVEVAMGMGHVTRDASGRFVVTGGPTPTEQAEAEAVAQDTAAPETRPVMDAQSEALLSQACAVAPSQVLAASAAIIGAGSITAQAVEQIATGMGIEPAEARARIAVVMKGYADEAVTHAAKAAQTSNVVAQEALAAFSKAKPSAFREAAERHAHTGMPDYGTAVVDYVAALEQTDPQRILSYAPVAGRHVYFNQSNGRIMVRFDGTETTWDNSVRQRLITVK